MEFYESIIPIWNIKTIHHVEGKGREEKRRPFPKALASDVFKIVIV